VAIKQFVVRRVSNHEANALQVANHYLGRKAQAVEAFGLFEFDDVFSEMIGCVIFGKPASPSLCVGVCGKDEAQHVIELTRLWIDDRSPKNAESFLISKALKMLNPVWQIVVSYAEISAGHVGVVYQATNFIYTGLSDAHVVWLLDGKSSKHDRHLFDEHGGVEGAKAFFGDRLVRGQRGRKHRYVFFRGSNARKRELLGKLRYEVKSYPKSVREGLNEQAV
jgi:hypothetical protein